MKPVFRIVLPAVLASALTAAIAVPLATAQNEPAAAPQLVAGLPDFTQLVEQVAPGVVTVNVEVGGARSDARKSLPREMEDMPEILRRMLPPGFALPDPRQPQQTPRGRGMGTGFLISNDGYLLTNHHVVANADNVRVTLADRRSFTAKVVGSDEQSDVALLKIDAGNLPALRIGNSAALKRGQWVVAIGSPFGLDQSVTAGVVSAVGRANPYSDQRYVPFIQTDVAINRGNSGGPLLNTRGEVIGINSQIFSNSGGYMGVSFAIPIDTAMNAVKQLKATGRVSRGQIGVQVGAIDEARARALGLPDTRGALVNEVLPGSAGEKAGLQALDVIRAINGAPVNQSTDVPPMIGAMAPGSRVTLSILRDGKTRELAVTLGELDEGNASDMPRFGKDAPADAATSPSAVGLALQNLSADDRRQLGLKAGEGVGVVDARGDAAEAGISRGDVILAVGRTAVGSAAELQARLRGLRKGDSVMLLVQRGGRSTYLPLTVTGD